MSDSQNWLDSLKEGDKVAIDVGGYGFSRYSITTITKITPSRIIKTTNGYTFNKDGSERGKKSTWDRRKYLEPVTQEILERLERSRLLSNIKDYKFENLPLEKLREIASILE